MQNTLPGSYFYKIKTRFQLDPLKLAWISLPQLPGIFLPLYWNTSISSIVISDTTFRKWKRRLGYNNTVFSFSSSVFNWSDLLDIICRIGNNGRIKWSKIDISRIFRISTPFHLLISLFDSERYISLAFCQIGCTVRQPYIFKLKRLTRFYIG